MGFLSKVFKAPLKIVDTIVDVGTDIVKAPFQVVEDVYQGARNIGSTGLDLVADVGTGVGPSIFRRYSSKSISCRRCSSIIAKRTI